MSSHLNRAYRSNLTCCQAILLTFVMLICLHAQAPSASSPDVTPHKSTARVVLTILTTSPSSLAPSELSIQDNKKPITANQFVPAKGTPAIFSLFFDASGSLQKDETAQTGAATQS